MYITLFIFTQLIQELENQYSFVQKNIQEYVKAV